MKWMVGVFLAIAIAIPTTFEAEASPTNNYYVWQIWAYVHQYREKNTGDVVVWFEDSNGNLISNFPNGSGTNQCPSNSGMVIGQSHPLFERLSKATLSAGLARRKVKVAYEGVSGTCYLKMLTVDM